MSREFFRSGDRLIPVSRVSELDLSRLDTHAELRVELTDDATVILSGVAALDLVYQLAPFALEGRRLRWQRRAWSVHNLVAHPLLEVLARLGRARWGLAVHDALSPRPVGVRGGAA